jgi:hypothetical protein
MHYFGAPRKFLSKGKLENNPKSVIISPYFFMPLKWFQKIEIKLCGASHTS